MTGSNRSVLVTAVLVLAAVDCTAENQATPVDPNYASLVEPATRKPSDDVERTILARLADLAPAMEASIDGQVVVAGAPYHAASGRTCRSVTIRPAAKQQVAHSRLACLIDGTWAFVPEVLPGGEDASP